MVRVGLVGCGTIGTRLAVALHRTYAGVARLAALHDADPAHAERLRRRLTPRPAMLSLPALIQRVDIIVEAASAGAAPEVVRQALAAGRTVLVMSVGGLLQDRTWQNLARRSRGKVCIPSGALAGLDGIVAMALGRIHHAQLTTRKPPTALAGSPYVRRRRLALERLRRPTVIFEGTPQAVVRAFPQNTNVAAALTLAIGPRAVRPRVRVVADPALSHNVHELEVESDCGRIQCRIESRPSVNPKTSELAVRSAIVTLGRLFDHLVVGT